MWIQGEIIGFEQKVKYSAGQNLYSTNMRKVQIQIILQIKDESDEKYRTEILLETSVL